MVLCSFCGGVGGGLFAALLGNWEVGIRFRIRNTGNEAEKKKKQEGRQRQDGWLISKREPEKDQSCIMIEYK